MFKKLLIIAVCAALISACSTGVRFDPKKLFKGGKPDQVCDSYQSITEEQANAKMNLEIYQLQQNVERSLVFREKMAEKLAIVNVLTEQDKPFPPVFIDKLSQTIQKEIDLIRPVLATVAKHGFINENDRLRRFLNNEDKGYGRDAYLLESLTDMFVNTDLLSYTTELIERYHDHKLQIDTLAQDNINLYYLVQIIEQSKSYPALLKMDYFDAANHRRKVRRNVTSDTLGNIGRSVVNGLSEGFSNAVGDYEERKGLLYNDKKLEQSIARQLQIGDILLEKTPFRLTDSMIPGHWGHAAVWVGTEQELRAIGLWDHPLVMRYHEQIKRGELVAESLRTGTTLSSLSHFLNIDDLGVLRSRKPLTDDEMRDTIILTLRQIGKEYDFNFDVETTDKIVCSQLVYLAYDKIEWPTKSVVGRYTISPDNIAIKALNNGPFELVLFYHDGKLVEGNKLELMEELMKQE